MPGSFSTKGLELFGDLVRGLWRPKKLHVAPCACRPEKEQRVTEEFPQRRPSRRWLGCEECCYGGGTTVLYDLVDAMLGGAARSPWAQPWWLDIPET